MRSKGFKAKFMMAFWGLFVEAHYIAANNDTMEGSRNSTFYHFTDSVHMCNSFFELLYV